MLLFYRTLYTYFSKANILSLGSVLFGLVWFVRLVLFVCVLVELMTIGSSGEAQETFATNTVGNVLVFFKTNHSF